MLAGGPGAWRVALAGCGLPALLAIGLNLLVVAAWWPFWKTLDVRNVGPARIAIVPLGRGERAQVTALPLLRHWLLPLSAEKPPLSLEPGQTRRLTYDWDDVNFCWLVVTGEDDAGARVLPTGFRDAGCEASRRSGCCSPLMIEELDVPPLGELPPAPPELLAPPR